MSQWIWMFGELPLPHGAVSVSLRDGRITVLSTAPGGTLRLNGQEITIEAGKELTAILC